MDEEYLVISWNSLRGEMEYRYLSRKRVAEATPTVTEERAVEIWLAKHPAVGTVLQLPFCAVIRTE